MDFLSGQRNPTFESGLLWEEFEHGLICTVDVFRIARECNPAEGTLASTEEWTDIGGDKTREVECVRLASR